MLISGGKTPILNLAKMEDDPQRRKPDITRAKVILGWEPQVTLINSIQSYSIV